MRALLSDRIGAKRKPKKRKKSAKQRSRLRRLGRGIVVCLLLLAVFSWMFVLPLRWIDPPTTAFILQDKSGRIPVAQEWLDWIDIGDTAPVAVVASEDQKFAHHFGFDLKSIKESVEEFNEGERLRGASTISQQLAKNLYLWPGRSFVRKGVEAYFTMLIEASLPKKRILEIYLNVAEFGPGIYGVGAAANHYFAKTPTNLTNADAALLAAVLPNPKRLNAAQPSPYVRKRQRWIIEQMQRLQREHWIVLIQ